mmetsp:Transcript_89591/g.289887  ORF Transcript_89591/g.289887 Transcript_89591/m.289887 type:complete len:201 (-) Transcript_89591:239-841(-)
MASQSQGASASSSRRSRAAKSSARRTSSSRTSAKAFAAWPAEAARFMTARCEAAQPTVPAMPCMPWNSVRAARCACSKRKSLGTTPASLAAEYAPGAVMFTAGKRWNLIPSAESLAAITCQRWVSSARFRTYTSMFVFSHAVADHLSFVLKGPASSSGSYLSQSSGFRIGCMATSSGFGARRMAATRFWASRQVSVAPVA